MKSIQDRSENSGRSVVVLRVERDEAGNETLINQEGMKTTANDEKLSELTLEIPLISCERTCS